MPDSAVVPEQDARLAGHPAGLRRTFAIISHPDAGKTTLTEKLLLFGGAIHLAGAVKARGEARRARSDWMKIEQQRGISVTTSVMTFEYGGAVFNLLDTPGHEDFSRGHLPHADRRRFGGHGDRRRQGHRGADAQAVRGLPPARRADHHLHQQDGPRGADPFELLDEIASTLALDVHADELAGRARARISRAPTISPTTACWCSTAADRSRIGEVIENYAITDPKLAEEVELARAGYPDLRSRDPIAPAT